MGAVAAKLRGDDGRPRIKFFRGDSNLAVVAEGDEVVWTNFEVGSDHNQSFSSLPGIGSRSNSNATAHQFPYNRATSSATTDQSPNKRISLNSSLAEVNVEGIASPKDTTDVHPKVENERSISSSRVHFKEEPTIVEFKLGEDANDNNQENVQPNSADQTNKEQTISTGNDNSASTEKARRPSFATLSARPAQPRIATCETLHATQEENFNEIAVMSLNLLADCNLTNSVANPDDGRYKHAVEFAPWEVRLPHLEAFFNKHSTTDVFSLQEVDFTRFHENLLPMFSKLGFNGVHQWDDEFAKKGAPNHPFGVATLFRKDRWRESFRESRSRSLIIGLTHIHRPVQEKKPEKKKKGASSDWYIVNVHLEADPKKDEKRLGQLSSTLFNLSVHAKINPLTARVVVLGDFNSVRDESPFQWLINPSSVSSNKDEEENGGENKNDKLIHAFRFVDPYASCDVPVDVREAATYADPFAAARVDHFLFTEDTAQVLSVLNVPALSEENKRVGIFAVNDYPSDHYPVGCTLRGLDVTLLEIQEEEEEIDPNVCPLTEGQMRVLEFLESGAPQRSKGKPSPAELAALRAHTERINIFLSHLNKNQKTWVGKWRKKFKPKVEETKQDEEFRQRFTRSKSLSSKALLDFSGLSDLFAEPGAPAEDRAPSSALKPELKRRQTVHGDRARLLEM